MMKMIARKTRRVDLPKNKMAERDLKRYAEGYLSLIQQASDGIINVDHEGFIIEFNRKCEEIFQYARNEIVGRQIDTLIPVRFFQIHERGFDNLRMIKEFERSGRTIEVVGVKKAGAEFPIEISFFFLKKEKPYIFTALIRDITKRKEIERRIKRQNQELIALNSITQAISQSLDLEEVLHLALKKTLKTLDADKGGILLKEEMHSAYLQPLTGSKRKKGLDYFERRWWLGMKIINQVIRSGEITFFNAHHLNRQGLLKDSHIRGLKSVVSVPLKSKNKAVGVMNIGAYQSDFFNKEDIPLLQSIGSTISMAIENALLFQEVKAKNIEIESERKKLRQLNEKLIKTQEDERRWILRELHDEAGQLMSTLKIDVEVIRRGLSLRDKRLRGILDNAVGLVDQTTTEIRRIASHLHPSILDTLGLIPAIKSYLEDCQKRFHAIIEFNYTGFEKRLDQNLATVLYRCVQESLTNVWKHAGARQVSMNLVRTPTMIITVIKDDGKGFNPAKILSAQGNHTGLGILGIKERVSLVGGKVKIDSRVGSGTTVRIEIPVS